MNFTDEQLQEVISNVISEAKKKKEKAKKLEKNAGGPAAAYGSYAEALDFSAPLGAYNLYKNQGGATWGPHTSAGTKVNDNAMGAKGLDEQIARAIVRNTLVENTPSVWGELVESSSPAKESFWEKAKLCAQKDFTVDSKKK